MSGSSANPIRRTFSVWAYPRGVGVQTSPRLTTKSPSTAQRDQPTSSFISTTSSVLGVTPSGRHALFLEAQLGEAATAGAALPAVASALLTAMAYNSAARDAVRRLSDHIPPCHPPSSA